MSYRKAKFVLEKNKSANEALEEVQLIMCHCLVAVERTVIKMLLVTERKGEDVSSQSKILYEQERSAGHSQTTCGMRSWAPVNTLLIAKYVRWTVYLDTVSYRLTSFPSQLLVIQIHSDQK